MNDNPKHRYKLGEWLVDEAGDLDGFFDRLASIKCQAGARVVPFPARPATSAPAIHGGARVITFGPVQRTGRRAMTEFDRIRTAYFEQRQRADNRIRQGKIDKIRAEIVALEARDLPMEIEVRLDILRRDLDEHLEKRPETLLDIYMEDGEEG